MAKRIQQTQRAHRLGSACREEITRAEGTEGGDLDANRQTAMDYYHGRLPALGVDDDPAAKTSATRFTSRDVSQMVNAIGAQLTPMLTVGCAVTFLANGAADAESAKAESDAVSTVIFEHNQGGLAIKEAIRDALIQRNGVLKVCMEETQQTARIPFDPETIAPAELAMLLIPGAPNEERVLEESAVKITLTERRFTFHAVPIENMLWRANWPSRDVETMPFIGERVYYTRSDLIEMGVSKRTAEALPSTDSYPSQDARNRDGQPAFEAATRDQDVIECHECYLLMDSDGDGISERHKILLAGEDIVLQEEVVSYVPYAVGCVLMTAHRLTGESIFDHMRQIQDGKTHVSRAWFNNLSMANAPRIVLNENETDLDDVLNWDRFSPIRSRNPGNVVQFGFTDTGPSNLAALQYLDQRRTESGGAALDMLGPQMQIAGETAHGIERQYGAKELMVADYADCFAQTAIRRAFLLMHQLLRTGSNTPIEMEISDQWVQVDPTTWPARTRAKVTAGMSVGQRSHIQTTLAQGLQLHLGMQQQGKAGILSDDQTVYRSLCRWYELAGIEDPDSFWVDPSSPQAMQAAQQMQQQAAQQAQMMQRQQETLMASQLQLAMDQIAADLQKHREQIAADMQKHREEMRFKYFDANLDAEVAEAKIVGDATLQLEKQRNETADRRAGERAARGSARPERGAA